MPVRVVLQPRKARPAVAGHPWIFERAIASISGDPSAGDAVEVFSDSGEFIAHGRFNPHSRIRVRLYSWSRDLPFEEPLLRRRLENAVAFRRDVLGWLNPRGGCRLVYSESDGLSGLVVDQYADALVVQFNALAMLRFETTIYETLVRLCAPAAVVRRIDPAIARREGFSLDDRVVFGDADRTTATIEESGVEFFVDLLGGQKTGAFLDQRDNRTAVARYAAGRDVLDVFCYTGGFGLVALARGGAAGVLGLDSSQEALDLARRSARPFAPKAEYRRGDASALMTELARDGRTFGLVVCDPPKFAAKSADLPGALRGYEYIHRLAMSLVGAGGVLAACSCSGLLDAGAFRDVLARAARRQGREFQLLEMRGQAPDHPVALACPETAYLKCAILRALD
jgi:23S rRNA (cytosine1962-C5)-methyltransferase